MNYSILQELGTYCLYTSIIQKDGLEGVEKALHEYTDLRQEQTALILEELEMEMESNYFWCKRNVQTKGVAMGARYAPSMENLFMNMWEGKYIYRSRGPEIKFYRSYIDDVIILWEGTTESFHKFLDEIN